MDSCYPFRSRPGKFKKMKRIEDLKRFRQEINEEKLTAPEKFPDKLCSKWEYEFDEQTAKNDTIIFQKRKMKYCFSTTGFEESIALLSTLTDSEFQYFIDHVRSKITYLPLGLKQALMEFKKRIGSQMNNNNNYNFNVDSIMSQNSIFGQVQEIQFNPRVQEIPFSGQVQEIPNKIVDQTQHF